MSVLKNVEPVKESIYMSIAHKVFLFSSAFALASASVSAEAPANAATKNEAAASVKPKDLNQTVAEIDGKKISFSEFEKLVKNILPKKFHDTAFSSPETFEKVLRRVMQLLAIESAAGKANLMNDEDVKRKIEQATKLVVQKEYIQREIAPSISEEKIRTRYKEVNPNKFTLRHIVVDSKEKALSVIQQLRSGSQFNDLVKQHSIDEDTKNAEQPGYLGPTNTFELREVSPELEKLVTSTAKAAVVAQPFELGENGWSVIRVDNREPMPLEESKDIVKATLAADATKAVVEQSLEKAKVKLFGIDGKAVPLQDQKPTDTKNAAPQQPAAPATAPKAEDLKAPAAKK